MLETQKGQVLRSPLWDKQTVYWHKNHIVITFHTPTAHPSMTNHAQVQESIDSLNLDKLDLFLSRRGFKLSSFQQTDLPHRTAAPSSEPSEEKKEADRPTLDASLTSRTGKHLFRSPSQQGSVAVCFFNIEPDTAASSYASKTAARGNIEADMAPSVISLINNNLDKLRQGANIPIVGAMPNWLGGATPDGGGDGGTFGCPTCPPLPVPDGDTSTPGRWTISLPELSSEMQDRKGAGVTVFVLDATPQAEQIKKTAARVGSSNRQTEGFC